MNTKDTPFGLGLEYSVQLYGRAPARVLSSECRESCEFSEESLALRGVWR